MEKVSEETVIRTWLDLSLRSREIDRGSELDEAVSHSSQSHTAEWANIHDEIDPFTHDIEEVSQLLQRRHPGETAVLWQDREITWYRDHLSLERLKSLRFSRSPRYGRFRSVEGDITIDEYAEILFSEGREVRDEGMNLDIDLILSLAADYPFETREPLILFTSKGQTVSRVLMNEEAALAIALAIRYGKPYEPHQVYIGVQVTPILKPVKERLLDKFPQFFPSSNDRA